MKYFYGNTLFSLHLSFFICYSSTHNGIQIGLSSTEDLLYTESKYKGLRRLRKHCLFIGFLVCILLRILLP